MQTSMQLKLQFTRKHARINHSTCLRLLFVSLFLCCTANLASAQPTRVIESVPIRELTVQVRSAQLFANIFQVRQIANQQVLVNDGLRRQLILLDRGLAFSRVVLDSVSSASGERYGAGAAPIIPALADSTFFLDRESRALLLIDPAGKVIRTTAAPTQPRDFNFLSMSRSGVDANGNLVFRVPALPVAKRIGDTTAKTIVTEVRPPENAPILRANFETRSTDTVSLVKQVSGVRSVMTQNPPAQRTIKAYLNPLETLDEWALLSDGSVAIVRGADYHVDFVRPNGARESGPKLPFDWKRISEEDKQKLIDSARTAMDALVSAATTRGGGAAANEALITALEGAVVNVSGAGPMPATPPSSRVYSAAERAQPVIDYEIGPLKELPDYHPPIRQGAALGDADGNLWILPSTSSQSTAGELVYDVVNSRGALTERVRLPLGRSVAGFGRSGVVYLVSKETDGWRLERAVRGVSASSRDFE